MRIMIFFIIIIQASLCAITVLSMSDNTFMSDGIGLSKKSIGFLGCGKISSAVVRGYAGAAVGKRPLRIFISPRNEVKSRKLAEEFPDVVEIARTNEDVVLSSEIVFVGLLPGPAREILPNMPFKKDQIVISMMAAVDIAELISLVAKVDGNRVTRTVPLPSNSQRTGPILLHPPNQEVQDILSVVGTPVICHSEAEMKPLVSLTGHISSFFELMRVTQDWAVTNGVEQETARAYVSAFYSSLATSTLQSQDSLEDMRDEAATPGGLNEQSLRSLSGSEHFRLAEQSLQDILERLNGGAKR